MQGLRCPSCGSENIVFDGTEIYCADCGYVLDEALIDMRKEWVLHDQEDVIKHAHAEGSYSPDMYDRGLGSVIIEFSRDARNRKLNRYQKSVAYRLRKVQKRNTMKNAKNIVFLLSETDRIAKAIGLPEHVKTDALNICRKVFENRLTRGRSIEESASACVAIACLMNKIPVNNRTFFSVIRERSNIMHIAKKIKHALNIVYNPLGIDDYINLYGNRFSLSQEERDSVRQAVMKVISSGKLQSFTVKTIVAAIVYLLCIDGKREMTRERYSEIADISLTTMRKIIKIMKNLLIEN
jgi:transcription initiation factor TFIIB